MYEKFYGLKSEPFRLSPDHRFCFVHRSYTKAKAYMKYALHRAEGFVMVTGRPGTGKTTLVNDLLAGLSREEVVVAVLVSTQLGGDDLLRMVAFSFELDGEAPYKAVVLQRLSDFLRRQYREGKRALLVIDEAQDLSVPALEELRLLTNLQLDNQPLLQIFLLGQESLRALVQRPEMEQVHQRLVAACHLDPLGQRETAAYIRHRLERVGWKGDPAISEDVFEMVYRFSHGVPRRINLLCSRLFLQGSVEESHKINIHGASMALRELQQEQLTPLKGPLDIDTESRGESGMIDETSPRGDASDEPDRLDEGRNGSSGPSGSHSVEMDDAAVYGKTADTLHGQAQQGIRGEKHSGPMEVHSDAGKEIPAQRIPRPEPKEVTNDGSGRSKAGPIKAGLSRDSLPNPVSKKYRASFDSKASGPQAWRESRNDLKAGLVPELGNESNRLASAEAEKRNRFDERETPPVSGTQGHVDPGEDEEAGNRGNGLLVLSISLIFLIAFAVLAFVVKPKLFEQEVYWVHDWMTDAWSRAQAAISREISPIERGLDLNPVTGDAGEYGYEKRKSPPGSYGNLNLTDRLAEMEPRQPESESGDTALVYEPQEGWGNDVALAAVLNQPVTIDGAGRLVEAVEDRTTSPIDGANADDGDEHRPATEAGGSPPIDPWSTAAIKIEAGAGPRPLVKQVLFAFDSAEVEGRYLAELEQIADALKQSKESEARIVGYSDNAGVGSYNLELSRRRAAAVAEYLAGLGISSDRLQTEGKGIRPEQGPSSQSGNKTPSQDRMVEISVIEHKDDI